MISSCVGWLAARARGVLRGPGARGARGIGISDGWRHARAGGTRLIALSGYARADDQKLALDAGFSARLAKPVSVEEPNALLAGER
jgi:CheY-like chemotaxis protein